MGATPGVVVGALLISLLPELLRGAENWRYLVFGVLLIVGIVIAYLSLVAGRHGRWLAVEARAWALAYPLYLLAVVRPITSMGRFLLLDFPVAALVPSVGMRTSSGGAVVRHLSRHLVELDPRLARGSRRFADAARHLLRGEDTGR